MDTSSPSVSQQPFQYHISRIGEVIHVSLDGNWDMATDIAYFTELVNHIDEIAQAPWGIVVDMRKWNIGHVPDQIFRHHSDRIQVNRAKQKCEIWLVNSPTQAFHLQAVVESQAGLKVIRLSNLDDSIQYLNQVGLQTSLKPQTA